MSEHFIIPDTQTRPGLTYEHLTAAGNYMVAKKPDVVIHLGDHWDMHSLSSYDKGTKKAEGARYQDDIDAGLEGMRALLQPLWDYNAKKRRNKEKQYHPRMVFLIGNHEERIMRHINANPELDGKLGYARPWGGMARTRLNNIGFSFTMGHQQGKEIGEKSLANGKVIRACIAGSFYQHDDSTSMMRDIKDTKVTVITVVAYINMK